MKGNKLLLIIIITLVLVIVGGGVFAFMMFKSMTKEPESPIKAEEGVFELGTVAAAGGHGEGAAAEAAPLTYINNIYMSKKIVKISMVVEVTTKDLPKKIAEAYPAEAKSKMSEINDIINMIISSKTEEQLSGTEAVEKLKAELKHGIEEVIGENRVVRINFVEMIKQ